MLDGSLASESELRIICIIPDETRSSEALSTAIPVVQPLCQIGGEGRGAKPHFKWKMTIGSQAKLIMRPLKQPQIIRNEDYGFRS
jgi:hypothetical protein